MAAGTQGIDKQFPPFPVIAGDISLGTMPAVALMKDLGLPENSEGSSKREIEKDFQQNTLSSVLTFLTSLLLASGTGEEAGAKPSRYLVAKGLPTLPLKVVERVWMMEYIEMEEFLPTPRSLQLVEQGRPVPSLQESLVGALNQFQATQQDQRSQQTHNGFGHMDKVFHPLHGSDGKEACGTDTSNGGTPPHCREAATESSS